MNRTRILTTPSSLCSNKLLRKNTEIVRQFFIRQVSYNYPSTLYSSDPINDKEINKIHTLKVQVAKNMFDSPHIPKSLQEHFRLCIEPSFLIRKEAKGIFEKFNNKGENNKVLLHGPAGVGKSAILCHIAGNYAATNKIIFYIPSANSLIRANQTQFLTPSKWMTGRFDQNNNAFTLLTHFRTMNQKILKEMRLVGTYEVSGKKYESETSLLELIDTCCLPMDFENMDDEPSGADVLGILCKELHLQDEFDVVFAVDDFNGLYNMTSIKDFFSNPIHANQLSIVHNLRKLWHSDNNRILKIGSTTATGNISKLPVGLVVNKMIEKYGLKVDNYTDDELRTILDYYVHRKAFRLDYDRAWAQVKLLSGSNPMQVVKICSR